MEQTKPGVPAWLVAAIVVVLSVMAYRLAATEQDPATPSSGPATGQLKIDATLKPQLLVSRQGRELHLAYQLLDGEGRLSVPQRRDSPPHFTVYCNGREVGSGSFEYG